MLYNMDLKGKELVLNVLTAMMPYGVVLHFDSYLDQDDEPLFSIRENGNRHMINDAYYLGEVKPYLRPMSSMTSEEKKEYQHMYEVYIGYDGKYSTITVFDWLNKHHFDYRGLIELGLAIEVTEDNNPYER